MNLIVNADKNWAIGKDNRLLVSIPQDMKFFRETTTGKVVVMGRKTLESFPGGQPLKKRTNIVLTSDRSYQAGEAVIVHSMEELMEELHPFVHADNAWIFALPDGLFYQLLVQSPPADDHCSPTHSSSVSP